MDVSEAQQEMLRQARGPHDDRTAACSSYVDSGEGRLYRFFGRHTSGPVGLTYSVELHQRLRGENTPG